MLTLTLAAFAAVQSLYAAPMRVALTFDDGNKDHLLIAAPMLEERGWRGVFNIVTGWIGKGKNSLTWDDVRELIRRGHEVTTHTVTHPNLVKLRQERGDVAVKEELLKSAEAIRRETGLTPRYLCTPGVKQDADTARLSTACGLRLMDVPRLGFGSNNCDRVRAVLEERIRAGKTRADILHHGLARNEHGGWSAFADRESFRRHLDTISAMEREGAIVITDYAGALGDMPLDLAAWPRHATAAACDWRVIAVDQRTMSLCLFDAAPDAGKVSLAEGWRWCPKDDPGVKREDVRGFSSIDECKVVEDGRTIIVNASGEGVAGIDVATGRAKWYSLMSVKQRGAGPHSLDILPDGCVVVAVSTGADAVELVDVREHPLDPSAQEHRRLFPLAGAHGVVCDRARGTVFALGYTNLVEFAYDSESRTAKILRTLDYTSAAGDAWGHDLSPDGARGYYFSNHSGVWHFDPDTGRIDPAVARQNVKSFSRDAEKGDLFAIPTKSWWTDRLIAVSSDGVERVIGPFEGARIYKARWFKATPGPFAVSK